MKRISLISLFSLCLFSLQAATIYVNASATGDGSSWSNATADLQSALKAAKTGDEIWVAMGKYLPTRGNDRNASFNIPDGVKVYGGFAGLESALDQRNPAKFLTILSGEIGSPKLDDNSYTVIYTKNVSRATLVDGFTIMGGASNSTDARGSSKRCGAGWFNIGENGISSPTIMNCIFTKNMARDGAALYNFAGKNGESSPLIQACQFIDNHADLDGGAIYNDATQGTCNPQIVSCLFTDNEASYGGGVMNSASGGSCRPLVTECIFTNNTAFINGSGLMNDAKDRGICEPIVSACQFSDNTSTVGKTPANTPLTHKNTYNYSSATRNDD